MNFAQTPPGLGFGLAELAIGWESETVDSAKPLRSESECERWMRELLLQGDFATTEIKRLGADLG